MNIAVAGGTGAVGRFVVSIARERGHHVVVLSRSEGVDLVTGQGLPEALEGVDTVIDVASIQTLSAKASVRFFTAITRNLLQAEKTAGVRHHLVLSIVGAEKASAGYYAGKLAQEQLVSKGDVPWTILRATQFHEFAEQVLARSAVGPLALVPLMATQPVAAREVAEALMDAAEAGPQGRITDLGGPRVEQLVHMVRAYARKSGHSRCWSWVSPPPASCGTRCAAAPCSRTRVPPSDARRSKSGSKHRSNSP